MRVPEWCGTVSVLPLLALSPPAAAAQQPVALRYAPRVGAIVRTIMGARAAVTFREVTATGQRLADSVTAEMTSVAGNTRRVLAQTERGRVVEVQYDSLRTRQRLVGQAWKEGSLADAEKPALRVTLDDQLRIVAGGSGGLQADPVAGAGIASWRGVALPDHPVAPGETWTVSTVFRVPTQLGDLLDLSVRDSMTATATAQLDSVVVGPGDTLMYLTVRQTLGPVTLPAVDAGDLATIELAGSQGASLVWSTGWNAFVSGASQARVLGKLTSAGMTGGIRRAELNWSLTTRLQVRP